MRYDFHINQISRNGFYHGLGFVFGVQNLLTRRRWRQAYTAVISALKFNTLYFLFFYSFLFARARILQSFLLGFGNIKNYDRK